MKHLVISILEKYMGVFVNEILENNGGYFDKADPLISFKQISKIINTESLEKRDLDVHPMISGWIKKINEQLTYKTATPINYTWYEECYIIPMQTDRCADVKVWLKTKGCWSTNYEVKKQCIRCANGYNEDILYLPNSSNACIENFISNIYKASSRAWSNGSIRNSRFLLRGKAGEGKSAFINYILSNKQDEMWDIRLVPIRLALSRADFWKPYQGMLKDDSSNEERKKYIEEKIFAKVARILSNKYFYNSVFIVVEKDLNELLPSDFKKMFVYKNVFSRDEIKACVLEFNGLRPADEIIEKIEDFIKDNKYDECLRKDFDKLLKKIKKSLSEDEKQKIKRSVAEILDLKIDDKSLSFFDEAITKDSTDSISNNAIVETIKAMGNLENPYRFWIILDGLDPHHQNDKMERVVSELIYDLIQLLFLDHTPQIRAAYLLVMREETIYRRLEPVLFPGGLWGDVFNMGVVKVTPCEIFNQRIVHSAQNEYYEMMGNCFVNFCSYFFHAVLTEKSINRNNRFDERDKEGFPLISALFRGNRRTMLRYMNVFMRDVYTTIQKKGVDFNEREKDLDKKTVNDARLNAFEYFNKIYESHTFWDSVLYRDLILYHNPIKYNVGRKNTEDKKSKKLLERNLSGMAYEHEVFPNIFNSVFIKETMEGKNLSYIKIFIMRLLEKCNFVHQSVLINIVKELYDFKDSTHVEFEIDELIVNRFIHSDSFLGQTLEEDPILKPTEYWNCFKKWFFFQDVFTALSSDINVPYRHVFAFNYYTSYVSRKYEWLMDKSLRHKWKSTTNDALASKLITVSIIVSYLCAMDCYMRGRYYAKEDKLVKIFDGLNSITFDDISIKQGLKKIVNEIVRLSEQSSSEYGKVFFERGNNLLRVLSKYPSITFYKEDVNKKIEDLWWNQFSEKLGSRSFQNGQQ